MSRLPASLPSPDPSAAWDALECVSQLQSGAITAHELVDAAIARAEAWEPHLGAIVTPAFDDARAQAQQPLSGPLAGVPSFIKDLDDLVGLPTSMGSRSTRSAGPCTRTASSVAQFLDTGPISLGKSTTPEFGLTATTEPIGRQPTANPHDLTRSPGGSSGGAAALVAAGVVPLTYASDGGGSIRIPAAFCGLVGLKPSRGRLLPMERAASMPIKITTYGVLSRSVRDTHAFYTAVEADTPPTLPSVGALSDPEPLRIAVCTQSPTGLPVEAATMAAVEDSARLLEARGHHLEAISFPFDDSLLEDFFAYWGLLAFGARRLTMKAHGKAYDPASIEPWTHGLAEYTSGQWLRMPGVLWRLRRFTARYARFFDDHDVLLCPTVAGPAPRLGHLCPTTDFETKQERIRELVPFTPYANISGAPAVSVPVGLGTDGLPRAVQLMSSVGRDGLLLRLAHALEADRPWPTTVPGPPSIDA